MSENYSSNYCESCYDNREIDDEDSWYFEAPFQFYGNGPHYYGLEIETEVRGARVSRVASATRKLLGRFASIKGDGSLNCGFEIATAPASLGEMREKLTPLLDSLPSGLCSFPYDTTGIHIHATRKPLTNLAIAKIVCFINAAHNRQFIQTIAQRGSCSYSNISAKKFGEAAKVNPRRYEAVNLQNCDTIEFRLFKGTLFKPSVFKNLEFADALIHYCLPSSRSIKESQSRTRFIRYVEANAKTWPHLLAFIDAKWRNRETKLTEKFGYLPALDSKTGEQ